MIVAYYRKKGNNCRFSYAGNWELEKLIVGTNFEETMFVYNLNWEIKYLLQALRQLMASFSAYLSILIHFQNYSEIALLFFVIHY